MVECISFCFLPPVGWPHLSITVDHKFDAACWSLKRHRARYPLLERQLCHRLSRQIPRQGQCWHRIWEGLWFSSSTAGNYLIHVSLACTLGTCNCFVHGQNTEYTPKTVSVPLLLLYEMLCASYQHTANNSFSQSSWEIFFLVIFWWLVVFRSDNSRTDYLDVINRLSSQVIYFSCSCETSGY